MDAVRRSEQARFTAFVLSLASPPRPRRRAAVALTLALLLPGLVATGSPTAWAAEPSRAAAGNAPAQRPSGSALLTLDNGRAARGDLVVTTGIRGFSRPTSARVHALIMAIGEYAAPIPRLDGVAHDVDTARAIAERMGVADANMRVLRDGELTLAGMRRAFDALEAEIADGDQVFIYYSGHGGRQRVDDDGERCAESLVTVDGQGLIDAELEKRLKRLAAKAQKIIVFIDACHSGGVTTRGVLAAGAPYHAKYWSPRGVEGDVCAKPANVLTRGIATAARTRGQGGGNYVYVAAARDDEISLDQPGRGGVASQAWLACMAGAARDLDGSGGLSAEEIRACAQSRIDAQLSHVDGYLPHHVSLTGNGDMVLSYAVNEAAADPAPATVAATAPTAPTAATAATAATPVPSPATTVATTAAIAPPAVPLTTVAPVAPVAPPARALAALKDIYQGRDDRRLVTLATERPVLRIGQDALDITLNAREAGYVYLLMVGSDGQTFDLLFPNQLDRNNAIQAGETLRLPRANWQLTVQGPPGKDTLLAIVADAPRDFARAGLKPAGPFSVLPAVAAKDIQLVTASAADADSDTCATSTVTRNLAVQKRCSNAYGAALLSVEEIAR